MAMKNVCIASTAQPRPNTIYATTYVVQRESLPDPLALLFRCTSSPMNPLSAILLFLLARQVIGAYNLVDHYHPNNFFAKFDFWTAPDPTNGHVKYLSERQARAAGLVKETTMNGYPIVRLGVDHTNITPTGRPSVRIASKKSYNQGLVIADFLHVPNSTCGIWPAFWMVGPSWPTTGEIDIYEGIHLNSHNGMVLHTGPGCTISKRSNFAGEIQTSNCDVNAPGQYINQGCRIVSDSPHSYGHGLNSIGGGVYATLWTAHSIKIWFFPRGEIPWDIENGCPNPDSWNTAPAAVFEGACRFDVSLVNLKIVINTTFCGDWAGGVWAFTDGCASRGRDCADYVTNNPAVFKDTFWAIRYIKTFDRGS
ncbi:endo-1,3(4)-beta-glucanase [Blastomyces dermatitidis ER-3]|uniref:Endo-1,3(4)-beta-glucanase n=1 Tax=Ajellomyces dermatitidis (strain ER-3 / ATCC MYA-2586) TaxID=559297 RepID=A0ABP2EYF0_AJEDR|nr:endo-1,3(4)-beta-glucanase [Blastomyces dermatitidis ER-3]EEQ89257.2 endo-1,3(4)-beta-glucanase [Blastomyces dermatitidis ER-3]